MKKAVVLLLLLAVVIPLIVSCKSEKTKSPKDTTDGSTTKKPEKTDDPVTSAVDETFILNDVADTYYNELIQPGDNDKMTFSSHWGLSSGYYTRFVGGDEYWVTDDRVPNGQKATCTIKFFGHSIKIYGHTGATGGMASITIDGVVQEKAVDFYSPERTEALKGKYPGTLEPFFEIEGLENTDHTIVVTLLTDKKNPAQSGKLEIAVDYAEVTRIEGTNPTASGALPTIEGVFDGYIGNAYEYAYLGDYRDVYKAFQKSSKTQKATLKMYQSDVANSAIDILSGVDEVELSAKACEFKNGNGKVLDASCIELSFLEYVRDHESNRKVYDVLGDDKRVFTAKSYGVLWVSVATKKDTAPGTYTGKITVSGADHNVTFDYTVEVLDLDISAADAALTNELWMYPYSANRYYSGKTVLEYFGTDHNKSSKTSLRNVYLEDKYMPQLAEQIKLYAEGGGDVITVTVVEDAWNNQTTDPYPSMVKWTKKKDGTWAFDYTDFDKWVALNMENGVDEKIKCYSLASWNEKLIYLDEATGSVKAASCTIGSTLWKEAWTAFLNDFMAHTKSKGWFDKIYLSMDERSTEQIAAVCELVTKVKDENGKSFKMSMAINRLTSIAYFDYFEDIAISSSQRNKLGDLVAQRTAKGLTTTFYTCGATAGSLRNEPAETVDFFYFLYKMGCQGYLRWAFDAFPDDPLNDTLHWKFVAGDQNLIYPDSLDDENPTVRSSVRYQIMMESYKNICVLETLKTLSDEAKTEVNKLASSYSGYSSNVQASTKLMENSVYSLAKRLLTN